MSGTTLRSISVGATIHKPRQVAGAARRRARHHMGSPRNEVGGYADSRSSDGQILNRPRIASTPRNLSARRVDAVIRARPGRGARLFNRRLQPDPLHGGSDPLLPATPHQYGIGHRRHHLLRWYPRPQRSSVRRRAVLVLRGVDVLQNSGPLISQAVVARQEVKQNQAYLFALPPGSYVLQGQFPPPGNVRPFVGVTVEADRAITVDIPNMCK